MDENKLTEQNKDDEIAELKKQLEAAKAENQRLEQEVKFKDKLTGLWNRKYAEKKLAEVDFGEGQQEFTVICADVDNLDAVNAKAGAEAGENLLKKIAEGLQQSFGEGAVCCKMAGMRMCVLVNLAKDELQDRIRDLDAMISAIKDSAGEVDISYGIASHDAHPEKDADALLSEAEYELQMHKVSKQDDSQAIEAPKKVRKPGDDITVLMIDDSLIILRTLQMMLKDKYKVLMATAGMDGFEIAKSKQPDVILLDYNMPVVDGERIMYLLKGSNLTKNIPVIFISGVSDREKILKVASLKPAGYLLKPVQKDNLLNVIASVLQAEGIQD